MKRAPSFMHLGTTISVAIALSSVACKKEAPTTNSTVTNAAAAPAPLPVATTTAMPGAATPDAGKVAPPKKPTAAKAKSKQNELSIWDVEEKNEGIVTCGVDGIRVILPSHLDAPEWKVKAPKSFGAAKVETLARYRGPNADSVAFRWPGPIDEGGAHEVVFTSGTEKVTVKVFINPAMPCSEGGPAAE